MPTLTGADVYCKHAAAFRHAHSRDLLNALGVRAFAQLLTAVPDIEDLTQDGVADRPILIRLDRATGVRDMWIGRPNDWSGRRGLRARLLAHQSEGGAR